MRLALSLILLIGGFGLMYFRERQLERRYPGLNLDQFKDRWPGGLLGDIGALMFVLGCFVAFV